MRLFRRGLPALLFPAIARAEAGFPSRPIRLIVPYSAGGIADTVVRIVQPKTAEALGVPVIVENRTGASGAVGAAAAAAAPPDGYTLVAEGATTITSPLANKSLPLDYDRLVPVTQLTIAPYVLGIRADFPATDLQGFLAEARRRPGSVTFGTPGIAHIGHLMGELLQSLAAVKLEHIPYRGGANAARDLAGGQLDAVIISESSLRPVLESGKARAIGVTGASRRPGLPGVPAIGEVVPGYELGTWIIVYAPRGTPEAVQERLAAAFRAATTDPEVRAKLAQTGSDPMSASPAEARALFARDKAVIGQLMRATGLAAP